MAGAACLCAVSSRTSSNPFQGEKCKYAGQSVRALPIRILSVGKKRSPGVQLMVDEYVQKLKYYCSVEDVQIRSNPRNARDARAQVDDEDKAVMNIVRSDDWVVMLDERGQDIGSEQMAELLVDAGHTVKQISQHDIFANNLCHTCEFLMHEKFSIKCDYCHFAEKEHEGSIIQQGASRLSFCIGGPYGHGRKLREQANVSIKLSSLVLNHEIALLVLMEQLYRSWTILKGQNYHH